VVLTEDELVKDNKNNAHGNASNSRFICFRGSRLTSTPCDNFNCMTAIYVMRKRYGYVLWVCSRATAVATEYCRL
jgi:hypothetical protein